MVCPNSMVKIGSARMASWAKDRIFRANGLSEAGTARGNKNNPALSITAKGLGSNGGGGGGGGSWDDLEKDPKDEGGGGGGRDANSSLSLDHNLVLHAERRQQVTIERFDKAITQGHKDKQSHTITLWYSILSNKSGFSCRLFLLVW